VLLEGQTFANFNADNDPRGEHDFGSFRLAGQNFFWKIDYYEASWRSLPRYASIIALPAHEAAPARSAYSHFHPAKEKKS